VAHPDRPTAIDPLHRTSRRGETGGFTGAAETDCACRAAAQIAVTPAGDRQQPPDPAAPQGYARSRAPRAGHHARPPRNARRSTAGPGRPGHEPCLARILLVADGHTLDHGDHGRAKNHLMAPMTVAAARPPLASPARSSSRRAHPCRENICMSSRSIHHPLTRPQDIHHAPRKSGQLPQVSSAPGWGGAVAVARRAGSSCASRRALREPSRRNAPQAPGLPFPPHLAITARRLSSACPVQRSGQAPAALAAGRDPVPAWSGRSDGRSRGSSRTSAASPTVRPATCPGR
jgi:hypothetical protein